MKRKQFMSCNFSIKNYPRRWLPKDDVFYIFGSGADVLVVFSLCPDELKCRCCLGGAAALQPGAAVRPAALHLRAAGRTRTDQQ